MGVVEPYIMMGLQPTGPTRVNLQVLVPSPTGLTPAKWKQTATLCPLDWPSNYNLLRLWHTTKSFHQYAAQLKQQIQHRHMFTHWEVNRAKLASRVLFQRPAHYVQRTPPFLTWARPIFEQGALSPMSVFPANFPILCLPGDKLFQSKELDDGYSLPPVVHAFHGSKVGLGQKLQQWQSKGPFRPLACYQVRSVYECYQETRCTRPWKSSHITCGLLFCMGLAPMPREECLAVSLTSPNMAGCL